MKRILLICAALVLFVLCMTGCGSVKPEKMIEESPFLIGEWVTDYLFEDPLVTLNEDGTCVLNGVAGTWKGEKKNSSAHHPRLKIKLENKEKYSLHFIPSYAASDEPVGYIIDVMTEDGPAPFSNEQVYQTSHNKIDVLAEFPWLVGEWTNAPEEGAKITLREDGTCNFYGEETIWGMDYTDYLSMTSVDPYFCPIQIKSGDNGRLVFVFGRWDNEDSGYAQNSHTLDFQYAEDCQFNQNFDESRMWYNLNELHMIEITDENIYTYFEPVENVEWRTDDFGTVTNAKIATYLRLKEAYEPLVVQPLSHIAVEFDLGVANYKLMMNANETEYSRLLLSDEEDVTRTQEIGVYPIEMPDKKGEYTYFYGIGVADVYHYLEEKRCEHEMLEEWDVRRAAGTLALYTADAELPTETLSDSTAELLSPEHVTEVSLEGASRELYEAAASLECSEITSAYEYNFAEFDMKDGSKLGVDVLLFTADGVPYVYDREDGKVYAEEDVPQDFEIDNGTPLFEDKNDLFSILVFFEETLNINGMVWTEMETLTPFSAEDIEVINSLLSQS